jgi:hypothetical protein
MTGEPTHRLSGEEIAALKFAAHRQLARLAQQGRASPRRLAQRPALVRAVRILEAKAFAHGCELHAPTEPVDA